MTGPKARIAIAVSAVVLVAGVATGAWALTAADGAVDDRAATHADASDRPTVSVVRGDLSTTTALSGAIGYGTPAVMTARGDGTITWLPAPGTTIERGQTVYGLDGRPVPLFYGAIPLYRDLMADGATRGPDVAMVAQNLAALGFSVGAVPDGSDMVFTPALRTAVRAWQKSLGIEQTGVVGAGTVVVLPDAIRVAGVTAQLGDPAGAEILSWTSPAKQLWAQVPVDQVALLPVGAVVEVTLADGQALSATVVSLAPVSHPPTDATPGAPEVPLCCTCPCRHCWL